MFRQLGAYLSSGNTTVAWLEDNGKPIGAAITVIGLTIVVSKFCKGYYCRSKLTQKRLGKQKEHADTMESLARQILLTGMSEADMESICNLTLSELEQKLQSGKLKSIDVLHAYQKKALQVNKKTNALIDVVPDAANTALECDKVTDRSKRLLHGIPISVKDNFPMEGLDSTVGLSKGIGKPYSEDCVIIKVLRHQGAIPFVRTNIPQTLLSFDTTNPIFGQTYNPHGEGRSAGGSSGGEAALIGAGGSPLGIGSDIGGSIRIPAAFCGICGFKSTENRCSSIGLNPILKGQNAIEASYGPLARDVDSLVLMMRALLCQYHFDLDKTLPPIPFNEAAFAQTKKLRIGYYLDDGYMISVPCMRRAVNLSVEALRKQGHQVIPWSFPNFGKRGVYLWSKALFADGGDAFLELLKHDDVDHSFSRIYLGLRSNRTFYKMVIFFINLLYPRMGLSMANVLGLSSISEWHELVRMVYKFRHDVEKDLKDRGIDALVCPAFTMPAPPVGVHKDCQGAASYTSVMNVLKFPAGTIPVTKVTAEDTANMADYPTEDLWCRTIKKSMAGAEGMPIGVQVVSLPWQDETCLRIMKELETALSN